MRHRLTQSHNARRFTRDAACHHVCHAAWLAALVAIFTMCAPALIAQDEPANDGDGRITINLPENVELRVLIEYVSQRLKINIVFDEQIGRQRVTVRAPKQVDEAALLGLLQSALQIKNLVLVDTEQPDLKKIVQAMNLTAVSKPVGGDDQRAAAGVPITQVFRLANTNPARIEQVIRQFLTQPGGNTLSAVEQQLLIVTDYPSNIARVAPMIELLDQPGQPVVTKMYELKHVAASELAQEVSKVVTARLKAAVADGRLRQVEVVPLDRANQIALIGEAPLVEQAIAVARSLDTSPDVTTVTYRFDSVAPDRIDRLTRQLVGTAADNAYQSAADPESNTLIVTATPAIHAQITKLKEQFDQPVAAERSPVRFYKLANTTASEVMATIQAIAGETEVAALQMSDDDSSSRGARPRYTPTRRTDTNTSRESVDRDNASPASPTSIRLKDATITSDANTNSIIVVGPPSQHEMYSQLIEMLDKRRPQVLIEVTIVALDTSNGYSVGVEISGSEDTNEGRVITFNSFGLSEVNAGTGALSLSPGLGFNGALLSADIAEIVVRALANDGRAKVVSAPRILVNDNATGTLSSVNEAPVTSVNASDTVATTSFGGFVSAGTTITVTPHISEGDHLQLEYSVQLNSFTGDASDTLPPPRQTNSIDSQVTIPDGHAIIVGGLNRTDETQAKQSVPILGDIPVLEYLFSSRSKNASNTTLFVFVRPIILRDDQFRDLKFLSDRDIERAELPAAFPSSEPLVMR